MQLFINRNYTRCLKIITRNAVNSCYPQYFKELFLHLSVAVFPCCQKYPHTDRIIIPFHSISVSIFYVCKTCDLTSVLPFFASCLLVVAVVAGLEPALSFSYESRIKRANQEVFPQCASTNSATPQ